MRQGERGPLVEGGDWSRGLGRLAADGHLAFIAGGELGPVPSFVTVQVALVTCGVAAHPTDVVLLAAVDSDVPLQQRLATEGATTDATVVAVFVTGHDVVTQRCLVLEDNVATLQGLGAHLVHRDDMAF